MTKSKFIIAIFAIFNVIIVVITLIISSVYTRNCNSLFQEIISIASTFKELL